MNQKKEASAGIFASFGRLVDESVALAASAGSGKMSKAQFDEWWEARRAEAMDMAAALRERSPDVRKPVETMLSLGRELVTNAVPSRPPRAQRRHPRRAAPVPGKTGARR